MDAAEVGELVASEIRTHQSDDVGWHFRDVQHLREALVSPPEWGDYHDHEGTPWPLWVVLREEPYGYHVIYDPDTGDFGLATNSRCVVSIYRSFMETIQGM